MGSQSEPESASVYPTTGAGLNHRKHGLVHTDAISGCGSGEDEFAATVDPRIRSMASEPESVSASVHPMAGARLVDQRSIEIRHTFSMLLDLVESTRSTPQELSENLCQISDI